MREVDTSDLAWKLFKETGEIRYYMLYSSLVRGESDTHDKGD